MTQQEDDKKQGIQTEKEGRGFIDCKPPVASLLLLTAIYFTVA